MNSGYRLKFPSVVRRSEPLAATGDTNRYRRSLVGPDMCLDPNSKVCAAMDAALSLRDPSGMNRAAPNLNPEHWYGEFVTRTNSHRHLQRWRQIQTDIIFKEIIQHLQGTPSRPHHPQRMLMLTSCKTELSKLRLERCSGL